MCDCYKIGGPFIAEDPDCPEHGTQAKKDMEDKEAEIAALKAERDAAMKDAERYRWLRDSSDLDAVFEQAKDPGRWERTYVVFMQGAELDSAIDAAIAKAEGGAA